MTTAPKTQEDTTGDLPFTVADPVNAAILRVSEDRIQGFSADPIGDIATASGVDPETVLQRIRAMLRAGTIRRVRQTLMATNLAPGALVAWKVPPDRLDAAFDFMYREDPFSGHVVIRTADPASPGAAWRLWTTLKVPAGFALAKHAAWLSERVGAEAHLLMPARYLFVLGVGHIRRRDIAVGSMADVPATPVDTVVATLSALEWRVLAELKREFAAEELASDLWRPRAEAAGLPLDEFLAVGRELSRRGIIGRFSTFLEHVKPTAGNERVTRYNALFHWRVPEGRELEAGCEVGRFHIMTHAYWREGGPEFQNVNLMGVAHGLDKELLLAHKAAIDAHLEASGIPLIYTNVFWGGRSEIKPSEIVPAEYEAFCRRNGLDPEAMRS